MYRAESIEEIHKISLTLMDALSNATRDRDNKLRLCAIALRLELQLGRNNGILCAKYKHSTP